MSRLTHISGTNIKGVKAFNVPLSDAVVIVGKGMSGKTGILNALQLATLGYVPGLNRTNEGIFSLCSADAMLVETATDDGKRIERAFVREAKTGKISKNERIDGGLAAMPPVMIDAQEFYGSGERERTEMLFAAMNLADTPLSSRIKAVRDRLADNLRALKAIGEMDDIPNDSFQSWIERAINFVREEKKAEDRSHRKLTGATQSLAEAQVNAPPLAISPAALEEQLVQARAILETKRVAKVAVDEELKTHSKSAQARLALVQEIEALRPFAENVDAISTKLAEDRAELEKTGDGKSLADYWQARDDAHEAKAKVDAELTAIRTALDAHDAEVAEVMAGKCCPTCDANKPTWKKKAQAKFDAKRAELMARFDIATMGFEAATAVATKAAQAAKEAAARADKVSNLKEAVRDSERDLQQAQQAAQQLKAKEAKLAEMGKPTGESERQQQAANAENEYQDALDAVTELEKQQQSVADAQASEKQLVQMAKDREAAKANAEALNKSVDILEQVRNEFMRDGFKPLLAVANIFGQGILETPLEFRNGEVGRLRKNQWVGSKTFSGTERVVAYSAISAALGSQAPIRLVLADELGNMHPGDKRRFIQNVLTAIQSKIIDQFIGVDVLDISYAAINADAQDASQPLPLQIVNLTA